MAWLEALRLWAASDRIRASPLDGKLLRLQVGAYVRVGDAFARVIAREVREAEESDAGGVDYTCRGATAEFRLDVRTAAAGVVHVQLVSAGGHGETCELDPRDVEAFG